MTMIVNESNCRISAATRRNWRKLQVGVEDKLKSRANKTASQKKFIPIERCSDSKTEDFIESLIDRITERNWDIASVLFTLILNMFHNLGFEKKESYRNFLSVYGHLTIIRDLLQMHVPDQEYDILGTIYQSYITEGEKNIRGAYYTPQGIVKDMVKDFDMSGNKSFFDPCCGSGAFLLSLQNATPSAIYGVDTDPIAVMLAKANLMMRYKAYDFIPNIYEADFLQDSDIFQKNLLDTFGKFDFIASNPPWGASASIVSNIIISKETASYFFVKACSFLKKGGKIHFLMPVSILNVRIHKDIRQYLLTKGRLEQIVIYDQLFSGVTTSYASILFSNNAPSEAMIYVCRDRSKTVDVKDFYQTESYNFTVWNSIDAEIIRKIKSNGNLTLSSSQWALGIVTGDNKRKLHQEKTTEELEPIYTGKEIQAYRLRPAKYYISFDRNQLQQVAKDELYRAPEKLVYKFIGRKLTFAYDNTGALFLNSANILIPSIKRMSIKTVLAFLNSSVFQYLYIQLFNEVKILKNNLMEMPFPEITLVQDTMLSNYVDQILAGESDKKEVVDKWMQDFYGLTEDEFNHIKSIINGKIA